LTEIKEDQISKFSSGYTQPEKGIEGPDENDHQIISKIMEVPSDKWFEISRWAKETDNLQAWQRSISFSIGKLRARGMKPSRKQAIQGEKILKEARSLGFPV
jgi:hypothetical protein